MIGTRIGTRMRTRVFGSGLRSGPPPVIPVQLGWRSSGIRLGIDAAFGRGERISSVDPSNPPGGTYFAPSYFAASYFGGLAGNARFASPDD